MSKRDKPDYKSSLPNHLSEVLNVFGALLALPSVVAVLYFAFFFDTTVYSSWSIGRVHNVGLLNDRLVYLLVSLAVLAGGIILLVVGNKSGNSPGGGK